VTHWFRADLGVTLNAGKVSAWNDQVGAAHFVQATPASQPVYTAADATLAGLATFTADGVDDILTAPAPSNPPGTVFIACVVKLIAAVSSGPFYGSQFGFGGDGDYLQTFSGNIYQSGPAVNANSDNAVAAIMGNWARFQDRRHNNTQDYIKIGNRPKATGIACPLSDGISDWSVAGVTGALIYQNCAYREIVVCSAEPTPAELSALDAYFLAQAPGILV
jgi:hypothetical protein